MENSSDKKFNVLIGIFVLLLIIVLGVTIFVVVQNNNKVEHYENKDEPKVLEEELDLDDELVVRAYEMINVEYFENIISHVMEVLYSGEEVKSSDLTDEEKMFLTLNYYTKLKAYYMCSDEYEVSIDELSKLYFENDSFIGGFKRNTAVDVGYFNILYGNKSFKVNTMGCYGMEGPTSQYKVKLDKAEKIDNKLIIYTRLAYLYQDIDTFDEEKDTFYAVGFDNLEAKGEKIQDKIYSEEEINWGDYKLYQFEFKIDNDNLYFSKVSLAK